MRLFSVTTAVGVALVCAACAVGSWYRAEQLRSEADWLLERSKAQASEYAQSFDDTLATQQLETFARRRGVLEQAWLWQRGQTLSVLLAAVAATCAWMMRMLRRLQGSLDEASEGLGPAPRSSSLPVGAVVSRSRS